MKEAKPKNLIVSDSNYKVISKLVDLYKFITDFKVLKDELTLGSSAESQLLAQ